MCQNQEDLTYKAYIGSTDTSMKNRAGVYFKNYHYQGTGAGTKFERYLNYKEIVEIARNYIKKIGGFEKLAEWGLI